MSVAVERKGPWSAEVLNRFLDEATVPLRIAGIGLNGHPVLASLWYVRVENLIWCATQSASAIASILKRDARCSFEVSVEQPPYVGVRGPDVATVHPDRGEEVLGEVIDRYVGTRSSKFSQSLLSRAASEVAIAIEPRALLTWDFQKRMAGI